MPEPIVVLDMPTTAGRLPGSFCGRRVRSAEDVQEAFSASSTGVSIWLAFTTAGVRMLASGVVRPAKADRRLLVLQQLGEDRRSWLQTLFRPVVAPGDGATLLPRADLLDALCADNRDELFVAGVLDRPDGMAVLFRGNLEPVRVPLSWFPPGVARGARKNVDLELTDSGQAVRFGDYEASTHAILYEFDPAYRRRAKKRRIAQDNTFGGALRRLRILRELSRTAFEPEVTAKEVARIEHGEVARPRTSTLAALARRLGVKPEDIASY